MEYREHKNVNYRDGTCLDMAKKDLVFHPRLLIRLTLSAYAAYQFNLHLFTKITVIDKSSILIYTTI